MRRVIFNIFCLSENQRAHENWAKHLYFAGEKTLICNKEPIKNFVLENV